MIRPPLSTLALLSLLALGAHQAYGQADMLPMSRVAGALTIPLPAGKSTLVGLPNVKIVSSGTVGGVAGDVLTLASSPSVLGDVEAAPHAIKIVSRANQSGTNAYGISALITDQAGQDVTADLSVEPNVGDQYVIYQLSTIATLFGAANETGLTGVADPALSDKIYLTNAGELVAYFYNGTAWKLVSDPTGADQGGVVIQPGSGVLVVRIAGSDLSIYLSGDALPARHVAAVAAGHNIVNNPFMVSTSLSASDIQSNITGGTGPGVSDIVYLENEGVMTGYYYKTGGPGGIGWRALGDSVTDAGSAMIAPAKAILFKEQAGTAGFALPEPFAD
ncbi:hypothetical protein EI77_00126 [Prosthecobacter fusiformis]|uniref:Uncharacterized protein n=1 Tax=Prosthecobacter fusiformis TaxID=48464 RepID=A0A4R7SRN8_9BACT|nr:hypothetical protein [Prosthecobacter fusiformis]TDU80828.1 hypothetical protein EI77_00126 [Prosthecobacter fusiformis]